VTRASPSWSPFTTPPPLCVIPDRACHCKFRRPRGSQVYGDARAVFYVLIFSLLAVVLVVAFVSTVTRRRRELAREEAEMGNDPDWPEQP